MLICVESCKVMPNITTRSGRTVRWTEMPRSFALFSGSGPSHHRLSSAGFIIDTFGFRFSVHTTARNSSCRLIGRLPIGLAGITAIAGGAHDRHAAGRLGGDLGDDLSSV